MAGAVARLARGWFLLGMASAVVLASVAPGPGRRGGPLHLEIVTDVGVFLVFFLHGVGLSRDMLRAGAARWRLHAVVQAFTFVVFPLLGLAVRAAAGALFPPSLLVGFLYLCAIPSTISSSVALTAVARGNVVAALFNATLSSMLGVVLTPALVAAMIGASGEIPLARAVGQVGALLVLPLVLGQLARPLVGARLERWRHLTGRFDRLVVLVVVYASFCDSVAAGLWTRHGPGIVALTAGAAALLLALVLTLTHRTARLLRFPVEDEIAAVFCGSVKALAVGVPMAKVIFGSHPGLGLIVLPIMVYHQLQLFTCSVIAERYARRVGTGAR